MMKSLCTPAALYFGISMVTIVVVLFQNLQNTQSYTVGSFSCRVPNTLFVFLAKVVYVLFWTYVLNLICKDGHVGLSWLLVLLPWILMAVIMGMLLINQ
jgi:hypothetical protein